MLTRPSAPNSALSALSLLFVAESTWTLTPQDLRLVEEQPGTQLLPKRRPDLVRIASSRDITLTIT